MRWLVLALATIVASCTTTTQSTEGAPSPTTITSGTTAEVPGGTQLDWYLGDAAGPSGTVIAGVYGPDWSVESAVGSGPSGELATPDSPWTTASLAKVVTATATLILVDDGLVDLDAPFADYVSFESENPSTVRQVLSHRSRIPDKWDHIDRCVTEDDRDDVINKASVDPGIPVGGDGSYSNTNYLLLGLLIAEVTGQDPAEFMSERIFQPLGMSVTHWPESQDGPDPLWPSGSMINCPLLPQTLGTDGALVTTAADFDAFYRGLFGGGLLQDETLDEMLRFETEVFGVPYGLGIADLSVEPWTLYGFGGSGTGYDTRGFHDPARGLSVIFYTRGGSGLEMETTIEAALGFPLAGAVADLIASDGEIVLLEDHRLPWVAYCEDGELRSAHPILDQACAPDAQAETKALQQDQRTTLMDGLRPNRVEFTYDREAATVRLGGPVRTDAGLLVPIDGPEGGGLFVFQMTEQGWEVEPLVTWGA